MDVKETLYRIVAFVVLGVVLLLVGFLYNQLRPHIERWDDFGEGGGG